MSGRDWTIASAFLEGEMAERLRRLPLSEEETIRCVGFAYDVFRYYDPGFQLDEGLRPIPNALSPLMEKVLAREVLVKEIDQELERHIRDMALKWLGRPWEKFSQMLTERGN